MQPSGTVRKMPCPAEKLWTEIAAGAMSAPEAERLALHAAECPGCAALLRSAINELAGGDDTETPAAEDESRRKAIAAKMAAVHRPRQLPWRSALSVAAGLAAAALGLFLWNQRAQTPLGALAQAYANPRRIEFRMDGAPHAPLQVLRSDNQNAALPPEVFESQAQVLRALAKRPQSAEWLHAKGRVELLQNRFDDAIASLQGAADLGAHSPAFWVDFGMAYAIRAERRNAPVDHTRAIELFGSALEREPKNKAALFNRALSEERLALLDGAIRDLENCLAAETDPGWRDEIARKLAELRKKRADAFDPARPAPASLRDELAFEQTLRDGLPSQRDLARRLREQHGDPWLEDALAIQPSPARDKAVEALAALSRIRLRMKLEEYAKAEESIQWLSAAALPVPLAAWRDFELLFRASHRPDPGECPLGSLRPESPAANRYPWFAAQAALEQSTCDIARGALDAGDRATSRAIRIAAKAGYGTLGIRARGFEASHLGNAGRYREAIASATGSLAEILDGRYPLQRAHQFYLNVARSCERLERWQSAREATRMSVQVAETAGMQVLAALGLLRSAEISHRLGDGETARAELLRAQDLTRRIELDADAALYRSYAEARLWALEGDYSRVAALEANAPGRDLLLEVPFLNALAELELRRSDPHAAIRHSKQAIGRIMANSGDRERFRSEHRRAVQSLMTAMLDLGEPAIALAEWRGAFRESPLPPDSLAGREGDRFAIVPTAGSIGVFVDNAGNVRHRRPSLTAQQALAKLRRLLALSADFRSDPESIRTLARDLAAALFGNSRESPGRIAVEADREWASLPLALLFEDAPSALAVPGARRSGCSPPPNGLALAQADRVHPDFSSLLKLPSLDSEAAALAPLAPGLRILRGEEATPAALRRAAETHRWLHVSGHAIRWRAATAIVAAPDPSSRSEDEQRGLWTLDGAGLCAEVAFFSACSTAAFHESETAGPAQLGEAAVRGGARWAVATLWDIDSNAATEFATHFYSAMRRGLDPPAALSAAARTVRGDPRYRHPYYWAPFVIYEAAA